MNRSRIFLLAATVICVVFSSGSSAALSFGGLTPQSADDEVFLQRISQLAKTGDKQALSAEIESHVRQFPKSSALALMFVAGQLADSGKYAEAIPLYLQAFRIQPTNPFIYFYLGLAYHALNKMPESYRVWDELPRRFPGHPLSDYQAALRLIDRSCSQEALPLLEHALSKLESSSFFYAQIQSTVDVIKPLKQECGK